MKILSNILVKAGVIVDNYIAIGTNSPFAGYNIDSRGSHNFGNTTNELYHYFSSSNVSGGSTVSVYVNNTSANSSRSHIMLADTTASVPTRFGLGVYTGEIPYAYLDSASKLVINNASQANVIIGTTVDNGYKFQVNGDITAVLYRGSNGAPLITFDGATNRVKIDGQGYGATAANSLIVGDYLSVEARAVFNNLIRVKGSNSIISYAIGRPDAPALDSGSLAGMGARFNTLWYTGAGLSFYVSEGADISGGFNVAEKLRLSPNGDFTVYNLAGTGTRMVVTDSSGVLSTQAIPSISNYVTTDTTQTISGQKTFSALTTIFDSTQTATFIEGRASGVLYGGMSFSLYMQFNAYAAATGGYLWKNGAGDNVMALSQAGALTITNLAGSGDRMVVADSNGVLTTQAIPSGGTSASTRTIQKFTSTASQTTFTITGGYTVGMVDVFLNGVKIDNATDFTATNGTTVVLTEALAAGQTVEVYKYGSQFIVNNGLRQTTLFSATAGQTTFTVSYSVGLVDVFYNGSKLDSSEYTATNGTSIVLGTACAANDKVEVIAYSYNVGAFTGVGGSGTTNYHAKWTASGTLVNSLIWDNGTNVGIGNTNTTYTFDVTGTGRFTSDLSVTGGSYFLQRASSSAILPVLRYWNGTGNPMNGGALGDILTIGTQGTNDFVIATDNVRRLTVLSNGQVGIGITPTGSWGLQLYGNGSANTVARIQLQNSSTGSADSDGGGISMEGIDFVTRNNESTGVVKWELGGTERMRITSGGNLQITASDSALYTRAAAAGKAIYWDIRNSSDARRAYIGFGGDGSSDFQFSNNENGSQAFITNGTERMRITNGGDLLIGKTSVLWTSVGLQTEFNGRNLGITNNDSSNNLFLRKNDTTGTMIQFWYNNNSVGNIGISTTNTTYATTSDYRLKEDLKDFNGIELISKIKTYDFKWKSEDRRMYGVIAHELQDVIGYAVVGEKDNKEMQSVDYSLLTPLLVKAIQEEDVKVNVHEVRIAELEQEVTTLKSQIAQFGSN